MTLTTDMSQGEIVAILKKHVCDKFDALQGFVTVTLEKRPWKSGVGFDIYANVTVTK